MMPFTGALLLVVGFLCVELVMTMLGGSLMGDGSDTPEIDGADFDGPELADGELHLETDMDAPELDSAADTGTTDTGTPDTGAGGIAAWLGFGDVPFVLWLSGLLTAFGIAGYVLQLGATTLLGAPLGWPVAVAITLLPSLHLGGRFARLLGRIVPKTETSAINRRSLGGRRGVVIQGTAQRGKPAQARVQDGFGNWHYVRIEPVDDHVSIPARTEVMIRSGRGPVLYAIPLEDNTPT